MAARDLRIGDADRDRALTALGEHFAEGRLGREEYDDRAAAIWTARTRGDLEPMFADLPGAEHALTAQGRSGHRRAWGRHWAFPFVPFFPVIVVLVVLSAITHLPLVLLPLVVWLVIGRRVWRRRVLRSRMPSW